MVVAPEMLPLIKIENLHVSFPLENGVVNAVQDVSFSIPRSHTVGLVGESGCGKSMTGLSLLQLVPPPGRIQSGRILFHAPASVPVPSSPPLSLSQSPRLPLDIATMSPRGDAIRELRGGQIAMIFQEPTSSLNPVYTIGEQIAESVRLEGDITAKEARNRAVEMLRRVGIPDPHHRANEYPHQLSGGMRQRAMIAIALARNPLLLIADEPTTALDVTVQAQILDLMRDLQQEMGMAILLISHDLGVIADLADEVVVMYAGKVVEQGSADAVFYEPQHPYTRGLLRAAPVLGQPTQERLYSIPGSVPNPLAMPRGCAFRPRCPERLPQCLEPPALLEVSAMHKARCWAREARHGE
jgi:oligopeptide/dipeptide ABC transporter ATP-binding protein